MKSYQCLYHIPTCSHRTMVRTYNPADQAAKWARQAARRAQTVALHEASRPTPTVAPLPLSAAMLARVRIRAAARDDAQPAVGQSAASRTHAAAEGLALLPPAAGQPIRERPAVSPRAKRQAVGPRRRPPTPRPLVRHISKRPPAQPNATLPRLPSPPSPDPVPCPRCGQVWEILVCNCAGAVVETTAR